MSGVCRYFNTLNGCRFGDRCRYEHIPTTSRSINNGTAPCQFYRSKRGCRYGNSCYFSHTQPRARSIIPSSAPPSLATTAGDEEEAATNDDSPLVVEAAAKPEDDASIDTSRAVVLYDPKVAEENLKAAVRREWKRKPGTELLMAKCSQCKVSFSSSATPEESCVALREHYIEKFGKVDQRHVRLFQDNCEFGEAVYCVVCDRSFHQYRSLFRHMRAKMLNKRDPKSAEAHKKIFEEIAQPFVDRDTGYEIEEDDIICSVIGFMTEDSDDEYDDYDFSDDDDCDDGEYSGGAGLLFAMGLAHALRNRNNGHGIGLFDDDDDDDEYGPGMLGFSGSDCYELMCQGVKPWDDEAGDVLAVLNGEYYW